MRLRLTVVLCDMICNPPVASYPQSRHRQPLPSLPLQRTNQPSLYHILAANTSVSPASVTATYLRRPVGCIVKERCLAAVSAGAIRRPFDEVEVAMGSIGYNPKNENN